MNTTDAFNTSQPTSGLNNTGFVLPVDAAYQTNDGSLYENIIVDQNPFMSYRNYNTLPWNDVPMPYGNYNMLPPNEIAVPGFGYDQGYEDQFMSSQNMTVDDNLQYFDNTANIMAFPDAANVPAGSVAAVQAPPAAIQPAPGQRVTCTVCLGTFSRASDLTRHMNSFHPVGPRVLHFCPVLGCPKSSGRGYSRQDKVTEHLRKVHGFNRL
ncbi:Zinc finger C2H2 protein [Rutstroemia sp. NJR-2017a BVV2]|nr:Zinc finger C2H2 protein [Rutstroemia sp. NJR-2017a BVV2]